MNLILRPSPREQVFRNIGDPPGVLGIVEVDDNVYAWGINPLERDHRCGAPTLDAAVVDAATPVPVVDLVEAIRDEDGEAFIRSMFIVGPAQVAALARVGDYRAVGGMADLYAQTLDAAVARGWVKHVEVRADEDPQR